MQSKHGNGSKEEILRMFFSEYCLLHGYGLSLMKNNKYITEHAHLDLHS